MTGSTGSASQRSTRGSRKHVLDWVESPTFLADLQNLVAPVPCRISTDALYKPTGHEDPKEARLDTFGPRILPSSPAWAELRSWWLRHSKGANTPNWDLAVACEIAGSSGLILVEAKANVTELSTAGKAAERESAKRGAEGRQRSAENQAQIKAAIKSASEGLQSAYPGTSLTAASHYQLANRVAFAWKLATESIPVVLVYLGFWGDKGMRRPLRNPTHWKELFETHLEEVVPGGIPERPIATCAADFWLLCRAKEALEHSPPAVSAA
jgi:hypothetical protein